MSLIKQEVADVFIYLARLADTLGIDIEREVLAKISTKNNHNFQLMRKCIVL
ncbi:MAG TPA: MazG-like family protein [Thermodesulfovibrionales bacterium]|jgi:NTP pyrophosphatase (non-canonical NTP hydrolase)|nr:MazG-like family protein [Thermodesulfovibrionales bacterium]